MQWPVWTENFVLSMDSNVHMDRQRPHRNALRKGLEACPSLKNIRL